ncbi:MAG: replication initiation protein, partial [Lactococcus lactis]|nr:replication initiation protein [Lactococcus lactis]
MGNGLFKTDRELNDDYIEQRRYFVVEHNDLITKAKHDLTAKELKVMDYIISKIKPNDAKFHKIFTS